MPKTAQELEVVIGLEVHAQLATKTKLFCSCSAQGFGEPPNTNICPVCTGQPGVLPVLNKAAVELGFKAALALDCKIRPLSIFARKNYFYPDLPKNYQISQYEEPFSEEGCLEIEAGGQTRKIGIQRVHMEEDAGKLLHAIGSEELPYSLVDFNRSGVPLIEIVSKPDLRSSEEAHQYLTSLKRILQYVGVSNCDMEKGELRCDANISLRPRGSDGLGTKVEVKNLNSFRGVKDALDFEAGRQAGALSRGERILQETRLWDAARGETASMRSKEEAHDYRYFPDPDLVPLEADSKWTTRLKSEIPELGGARKERFVSKLGLSEYDAGVLTGDKILADYFEEALRHAPGADGASAKAVANWVLNNLLGKLTSEGVGISKSRIGPVHLGALVSLIEKGTLSSAMGKQVFEKMWETGGDPKSVVESLGGGQVSDDQALKEWAKAAIQENPKAVEDFRGGKAQALGALVGQVMKKSKGKANPQKVGEILRELLQ